MHAYIHTYLHTCMHAYIHTCTHAHTHTYIYMQNIENMQNININTNMNINININKIKQELAQSSGLLKAILTEDGAAEAMWVDLPQDSLLKVLETYKDNAVVNIFCFIYYTFFFT